jgi:hypothetical protein
VQLPNGIIFKEQQRKINVKKQMRRRKRGKRPELKDETKLKKERTNTKL